MEIPLNKNQDAAASAPRSPLLIVAGAGTGKTRTITARLVRLIERGVPPEKICAITFTNKAAREMAERVNALTMTSDNNNDLPGGNRSHGHSHGRGYGWPFIGTFHSLGARILRKEAYHLGRKPNFVIFDDHDSFDLIKRIAKKYAKGETGAQREKPRKNTKNSPAFFASKISEIKNTNVRSSQDQFACAHSHRASLGLSHTKSCDDKVLGAFTKYEDALRENNAFDFDDLIEKVVRLFRENLAVLKKYRNKFDAVLVDEYQDLNPMQYEFVRLLSSGHRNLTVVGDDEQMIYGWRYADLRIFLGFERDWPGAQIAFLEENYRSTANIIGAAQAVAENNQYRRPKNLWTKNDAGAPITVAELADENEEAEWIAEKIESGMWNMEHGRSGDLVPGATSTESQIPNSKFQIPSTAVLYRTNAQSRAIEQALIRHKIPYQIFGGLRFYERREIKDVVAALRYILNGKDEISTERLTKFLGKRKFIEFKEVASGLRGKNTAPQKLIEMFLESVNYIEYLENNFTNHAERRENIAELLNFAARFDNLTQMLEEVALVQPTDKMEERIMNNELWNKKNSPIIPNSKFIIPVSLMTIHLAKGLEFDRVFIAGCSEGLLPHARSLDNEYQLEEERRLMYVAMTRAKKNLAISFYDIPSRFIGEIPEELTTSSGATGRDNNDGEDEDEEKYVQLE